MQTDISIVDPEIVNRLTSWEDFVTIYFALKEYDNSSGWIKADILKKIFDKHGDSGVSAFSKEVGEAESVVRKYLRLAEAWPPEKRIPSLSPTAHYHATVIDYDPHSKKLVSEKRFSLVEEASDCGVTSSRDIKMFMKPKVEKVEDESSVVVNDIFSSHIKIDNGMATLFNIQHIHLPKDVLVNVLRELANKIKEVDKKLQ